MSRYWILVPLVLMTGCGSQPQAPPRPVSEPVTFVQPRLSIDVSASEEGTVTVSSQVTSFRMTESLEGSLRGTGHMRVTMDDGSFDQAPYVDYTSWSRQASERGEYTASTGSMKYQFVPVGDHSVYVELVGTDGQPIGVYTEESVSVLRSTPAPKPKRAKKAQVKPKAKSRPRPRQARPPVRQSRPRSVPQSSTVNQQSYDGQAELLAQLDPSGRLGLDRGIGLNEDLRRRSGSGAFGQNGSGSGFGSDRFGSGSTGFGSGSTGFGSGSTGFGNGSTGTGFGGTGSTIPFGSNQTQQQLLFDALGQDANQSGTDFSGSPQNLRDTSIFNDR